MRLIFEKSVKDRECVVLPESDIPEYVFKDSRLLRDAPAELPELSELDLVRHYDALSARAYGVDSGFYPLGSCTMKYNPKLNETLAALPGFTDVHPLQNKDSLQGSMEAVFLLTEYLKQITGMDDGTLQPAAGAHGEFTSMLIIKAYFEKNGARTKIIVPDSAHGTNPASAAMAGFSVVNVPSRADGSVDLDALRAAVDGQTAALMLTNPNTLGIFDKNIGEISKIIHGAGGLMYYDGANLNAVMGKIRPGDMGFDIMHVNLHKTFSTPHGGGGPGSGPVLCKRFLSEFLPYPLVGRFEKTSGLPEKPRENKADLNSSDPSFERNFMENKADGGSLKGGSIPHPDRNFLECEADSSPLKDGSFFYDFLPPPKNSIGKVGSFYGNFLVAVKALAYVVALGRRGIKDAAEKAVLNANYMRVLVSEFLDSNTNSACAHESANDSNAQKNTPPPLNSVCMHEFVVSAEKLKHETGVSALDIAKALIDRGIHPPTMYFPLIVHEALMFEPTETESKETIDQAAAALKEIVETAKTNPEKIKRAPLTTPVGRPDEVKAARKPVVAR
ncbi:MAG: aminomethyl-transferring glycine dehydrogenase subunit GcvPB [Clostridiales bacterium]|jgi:glycine dehydrogenase subunit 2|nr:aminomethyl-transferring glycine dehydrogenase subunit GcvPB [Clostridiales bacterium]